MASSMCPGEVYASHKRSADQMAELLYLLRRRRRRIDRGRDEFVRHWEHAAAGYVGWVWLRTGRSVGVPWPEYR